MDPSCPILDLRGGITPIYAILKDLSRQPVDLEVTLIYCVHSESDILHRRDLETWFDERSGWQLHISCTSQPDWEGEKGRISPEMVDRLSGGDYGATFFLCGPRMLVKDTSSHLRNRGVPRSRIKQEQFVSLP
jgi:ferredoxin-NADP reductase